MTRARTIAEGQAVLRDLGRKVPKRLREVKLEQMAELVRVSREQAMAGAAGKRTSQLVAPTIRADGLAVYVGSSEPTSGGGTVADVLYGTMFGSGKHKQFPPTRRPGWYLYPEIIDFVNDAGRYAGAEADALEDALRASLGS